MLSLLLKMIYNLRKRPVLDPPPINVLSLSNSWMHKPLHISRYNMKIQLQTYIWYWNIRNAQRPITAFATGTMKLVKIRWVRPPCHPRKDLNQRTNTISDRTTSKCKSVQTRINICTKFKERKSIGEGWIWPPGEVFFYIKTTTNPIDLQFCSVNKISSCNF